VICRLISTFGNSRMEAQSLPNRMKGIVLEGFGAPAEKLKLRNDLPLPQFGSSEVVIRVSAASLNPVDFKIVTGYLSILKPMHPNPFIPGFDVSGEIAEVGANCKQFKKGDKVFAMAHFLKCGTLAEYVTINADLLAHKPSNMTFAEAATIPLVGITSYQALVDHGKIKSGERVFINGGSGGTGSFGIQLAKILGAEVATTCSERNIELVKSLGADHVIDYTKTDFSQELKDYDVVYDCIGGYDVWEKSLKILKPNGRFLTIAGDKPGPINPLTMASSGARLVNRNFWNILGYYPSYCHLTANTNGAQLEIIKSYIEEGKIRAIVDRTYTLENSVEAFEYQMSNRVRGKLVIDVNNASST